MNGRRWAIIIALMLGAACAPAPEPESPAPGPPHNVARRSLDREARAWVDGTLARLSLRQKVGQMVMPWIDGAFLPTSGEEYRTIAGWVGEHGVGGVVVSIGPPVDMAAKLNHLQRLAEVPLLVATDMEHGPGQRLNAGVVMPYGMDLGGGTRFPPVMALGATRDPALAYEMGRITALEARGVGIHLSFSPVFDVNNNPANPIINTRSYGEAPAAVAELATAQLRGMQDHGLLATAKHFPGHGDTSEDSHLLLPRLDIDRARADSVELIPFRAAIEEGVSAIMSAHIAFPALAGDSTVPATLSPEIMTGLLADELGFRGIVVTDALNMGAVVEAYGSGDAAVMAVRAGADILLMPEVPAAIEAVLGAVLRGEIDEARIDRSVRKLLEAKARVGLHRRRTVDLDAVDDVVGAAAHDSVAADIAARSITLARDRQRLVPLARDSARVLHVVHTDDLDPLAGRALNRVLGEALPELRSVTLYGSQPPAVLDSVLALADSAERVVVSSFVRVLSSKGDVAVDEGVAAFVRALAGRRPTIGVAFGNPYLLDQFPELGTYLLAWGQDARAQEAAARALIGDAPVGGRLPISIPPHLARGAGLDVNRALVMAEPHEVGMSAEGLEAVDEAINRAIVAGVTPGAALAVGRHGRLVRLRGYGRLDARERFGPVTDSTIFDLASLTKVMATTSAVMALVSDGLVELDAPVKRYLPGWDSEPWKDRVTVRDLLLHRAGLPPYQQLWRELWGAEPVLKRILEVGLDYEPGTRTVYSDFGFIMLGAIVERVSGMPLDAFVAERIFEPLGLRETGFNPLAWAVGPGGAVERALSAPGEPGRPVLPTPPAPEAQGATAPDSARPPAPRVTVPDPDRSPLAARIAPTEVDTVYRHTHVHGVVHDENAYAMGGVAGHAGLFSSARDLAVVAEMLMDGGAYAGRRILDGPVVIEFTTRRGPESSRALGWDTPAPGSSAGQYFSMESFGHTGFTGTSLWVDREREIFVVLLTNRVNPTRAEQRIGALRRQVADLVQLAADVPVAPRPDAAPE